jgi:hypothetical protein
VALDLKILRDPRARIELNSRGDQCAQNGCGK